MAGKTVCIIGAGVSGIVSIKACVESGLQPTCFEQHDKFGGVWYYTEEMRPNQGPSAYETLVTNSSKDMMAYSDFPMPAEYPPYLPWPTFTKYINDYVKHFDLAKHIRFNTRIIEVKPADDHDDTGRWSVTYMNGDSQAEPTTQIFDNVIICAGFFKAPVFPDIPGLDKFEGKLIHTHTYRSPRVYKGKRVLVIGNANSASDAAVDASANGSQAYLSVGDGTWVLSRAAAGGIPRDFILRRFLMKALPMKLVSTLLKKDCNSRFDHEAYGMQSTKPPLMGSAVMVNDEISYKIISGKLQVRARVVEFTKTGVKLEDGTELEDLDIVCCATGFKTDFSFINKKIVTLTDTELNLYQMVFPVERRHNTLALVGCFSTVGAHTPIMELQAYWVARVFSGQQSLPSQPSMFEWIKEIKMQQTRAYGKLKIKFNQLMYRDAIADEIGAKPKIKSMLFTDPALALKCFFGPAFPYQYRLSGPLAIKSARDNCMKAYYNTVHATKTRIAKSKPSDGAFGLIFYIFAAAAIALVIANFVF